MSRAIEMVQRLGGDRDPVVHMSRPEPQRHAGRRARWLVVSAAGEWLAAGLITSFSRAPARIEYLTPVPSTAAPPLELALARAGAAWDDQLAKEKRDVEHLENRRAALVAARSRLAGVEAEVRELEGHVAALEKEAA